MLKEWERFHNVMDNRDIHDDTYLSNALEEFNQSEMINKNIEKQLNSIGSKVYLLNNVADIYGKEYMDPVQTYDKYDFWHRIFNAVLGFFKKLIISISNFVRSIMNFLGSLSFKKQTKFYETHKGDFYTKLVHTSSEKTVNIKLPKEPNVLRMFTEYFPSVLDDLQKNQTTFDKYTKQLDSIYESLIAGRDIKVPIHNVNMTMNSLMRNMNFGKLSNELHLLNIVNFKSAAPTNVTGWIKIGPAKTVKLIIYADKKRKQKAHTPVDLGKLFSYIPFEFLSGKSAETIRAFNIRGKSIAKSLTNSIRDTQKILDKVDKLAGKKDLSRRANKIIASYSRISDIDRHLHGFITGMVIHIYKEFIYFRKKAYAAAKLIIKE
jgi:hypothetical protein